MNERETDDKQARMTASARIPQEQSVRDVMTRDPVTISRHLLAVEALNLMESRKITSIIVAGPDGVVEGVVHLHDLWRTELI